MRTPLTIATAVLFLVGAIVIGSVALRSGSDPNRGLQPITVQVPSFPATTGPTTAPTTGPTTGPAAPAPEPTGQEPAPAQRDEVGVVEPPPPLDDDDDDDDGADGDDGPGDDD